MRNKFLLKYISVISLLAALLLITNADAQNINVPVSELEFHYGININNVYKHDRGTRFKTRLSPLLFGLNYTKYLYQKSGISIEVDYVHKGPQAHDINYLVFSIMYTKRSEGIFRKIMVGPYYGKMFKYESYGKERNHESLKYYDFGIDLGLKIIIPKIYKNTGLFISPRIEMGLMNFSYSHHIVGQIKLGVDLR